MKTRTLNQVLKGYLQTIELREKFHNTVWKPFWDSLPKNAVIVKGKKLKHRVFMKVHEDSYSPPAPCNMSEAVQYCLDTELPLYMNGFSKDYLEKRLKGETPPVIYDPEVFNTYHKIEIRRSHLYRVQEYYIEYLHHYVRTYIPLDIRYPVHRNPIEFYIFRYEDKVLYFNKDMKELTDVCTIHPSNDPIEVQDGRQYL